MALVKSFSYTRAARYGAGVQRFVQFAAGVLFISWIIMFLRLNSYLVKYIFGNTIWKNML